jgi:hypothetical protein
VTPAGVKAEEEACDRPRRWCRCGLHARILNSVMNVLANHVVDDDGALSGVASDVADATMPMQCANGNQQGCRPRDHVCHDVEGSVSSK